MSLSIFIKMRWVFILGVIAAAVVSTRVFEVDFETFPVYVTCALTAVYNIVLYRGLRSSRKDPAAVGTLFKRYGVTGIMLDLAMLTVLLHYTGGIENPFIFFFVFHIVLASIVFDRRTVYLLATLAVALVTGMVMLEFAGVIPHVNLVGFMLPTRYKEPQRVVAVLVSLTAIIYISSYISTAISFELRKRQRQVVELREEVLREKTRELEVSAQEKQRLEEDKKRFLVFLGMAAHDLKAPLAAIQSYIGVMLGNYAGELNDKQRNMLQRSSARIVGLMKLISDLLDIPRIENGQTPDEMGDVGLSSVIDDCIQEQKGLAEGKGLQIRRELPETLPPVWGSAMRLRQALTNLINNAISYTDAGTVTVRAIGDRSTVRVEILDTGIGIPPADKSRLFNDFFRGSNVDSPGTGLGLSIAKRIIESHGGDISIESPCPDSNVGTKVSLVLPVKGISEAE